MEARVREALARSWATVARSRETIERSQAAQRRDEARRQRERERARQEHDTLASQMAQLLSERGQEQRETVMRAHAACEQACRLHGIARDTAERAASILNNTRAVRQEVPVVIRRDEHGQASGRYKSPGWYKSTG